MSSTKLKVQKDGKSAEIEIKRSELDVLPAVGGVCLTLTGCGIIAGVPLFLAAGFKAPAETKVQLKDVQSSAPGDKVSVRY